MDSLNVTDRESNWLSAQPPSSGDIWADNDRVWFLWKEVRAEEKILEDALQRKLHAVTGKRVKGKVEGRSKMSILLGWWVAQELIDDWLMEIQTVGFVAMDDPADGRGSRWWLRRENGGMRIYHLSAVDDDWVVEAWVYIIHCISIRHERLIILSLGKGKGPLQ